MLVLRLQDPSIESPLCPDCVAQESQALDDRATLELASGLRFVGLPKRNGQLSSVITKRAHSLPSVLCPT